MYDTDNCLPQYADSKRASDRDVDLACERVPFRLMVEWNGLDTTGPILAGEQHPPMATYIAAPTMAEAVSHTIRVTNAIALIR